MAPKSAWNKKATINTKPTEKQASPAINYGEVQSEELEALQAIYMEDYEEVETKSAWSKTTDRSFKLRLKSFSDEDSHVTLTIKLTVTYPKSAPILGINGLEGWHERTQSRIRSIITNRPKQMLGEVMIHAIASEVQEALEDAVTARQQGVLPSLDDERANAEETATELARQAEEADTRRRLDEQEDERQILKQMVDEELSRREKRRPPKPAASATDDSVAEIVMFDQASVNTGSEVIEFDRVELLTALRRTGSNELWLGRPKGAGIGQCPLVAVRRITVQQKRHDIMEIESVLDAARKLRHVGILNVLAFRVERLSSDTDGSCLSLCLDYADRGTLHDMLEVGALHLTRAKSFSIELLEALEYLHRHGLAHGMITCKSISITSTPTLSPKLAEFGYGLLLTDKQSTAPSKWQPPEGRPENTASRRRTDIWDLGVTLMQMFLGLQVVSDYHSPQILLGKMDLSDAFDDFNRKLFTADHKKRPSAFDLLPSEFLRTDIPVIDEPLQVSDKRSAIRSSSGVASPAKHRSRLNSSNMMEPISRYTADFTEVGRLGKGGFGEVVKARNKLDGGIYAVKKIKQAPQLLDQVISEVMLLNRLNHPYVVRYFSTWLETDMSGAIEEDSSTATVTTETDETSSDGPRMDFGYQEYRRP